MAGIGQAPQTPAERDAINPGNAEFGTKSGIFPAAQYVPAGYLAGGQGLDYHMFMKRLSREQVSKIVHYFEDGVRYVERKLAEHGIDCDYLQSGLIRAGIHESQRKSLRDNMKLGIELGVAGIGALGHGGRLLFRGRLVVVGVRGQRRARGDRAAAHAPGRRAACEEEADEGLTVSGAGGSSRRFSRARSGTSSRCTHPLRISLQNRSRPRGGYSRGDHERKVRKVHFNIIR